MERDATSSSPMLTATEARKASVQGRFLNPSTKRREVVKPTSNNPPTISQSHGIAILSLDARKSRDNLPPNDEGARHRQHDRTAAIPRVHGRAPHRLSDFRQPASPLGAGGNVGVRRGGDPVSGIMPPTFEDT